MGMTLGEKIIARAAGVPEVKPGDIHTVNVDYLMSNDGTTHLTIDMYNTKLKNPRIADKDKLVFIIDHNIPAENPKTAAAHKKMREFAKENEIIIAFKNFLCRFDCLSLSRLYFLSSDCHNYSPSLKSTQTPGLMVELMETF